MSNIDKLNRLILSKINNKIQILEGKSTEKLSITMKTPETFSDQEKLILPL